MNLAQIWGYLKRIPAGIWAAFGVAIALLGLYLRGRRLEAELAQAKLHQVVAQARANTAKSEGRFEAHNERVRETERKIEEIEAARTLASSIGAADEKRLSALKPNQVHAEYMKLLVKKRSNLDVEATLRASGSLSKVSIKPKKPKVLLPFDDEDV